VFSNAGVKTTWIQESGLDGKAKVERRVLVISIVEWPFSDSAQTYSRPPR
jgi:hypothetical protein